MKITDYALVSTLSADNVLLVDGAGGTKTILAKDLLKALAEAGNAKDYLTVMNVADLTQSTAVAKTDKLMVNTSAGNKGITVDDALWAILDACAPLEVRKNTFRGKNLGAALTSEQKTNIANGTFKGFFLGDYWEIGGRVWRIVDMDYWWNSGDTTCTTHHLVVMPDSQLYTAQMNETNITTGGYVGSKMYTENLENAKTLVYASFGETAILKHREYLTNAVSNGYPSAGAWYDSKVELPNEIMMYGSLVFTPAGDGSFVPNRYTIDKTQLALMAAHTRYINPGRYWHWLRDVVSGADFASVNNGGNSGYGNASISGGVRPVFGVIG